jgi:hypothetical protein
VGAVRVVIEKVVQAADERFRLVERFRQQVSLLSQTGRIDGWHD